MVMRSSTNNYAKSALSTLGPVANTLKRKGSLHERERPRKKDKLAAAEDSPQDAATPKPPKRLKHKKSKPTVSAPTPEKSPFGKPVSAKHAALMEERKGLPIAQGREAIVREILANDVTVLLGETGSGKTTQIPQYLLEAGFAQKGMIAVTQPRKVAATSLATRVALEQGDGKVGQTVGYSVRFDERAGPETRIKYVTDGMLVRELLSDSLLSRYGVVVVDEAHERTLRTDVLMANLKTIQAIRNKPMDGKGKAKEVNPLKIIIMSATLDAEKFSKFYNNAKIAYIKGRQHPVKIYHTAVGQTDYLEAAMRTFFQIHTDRPPGDVLIFLPGQEDIESLNKSIEMYAKRLPVSCMDVSVCMMYAALSDGVQSNAFLPAPTNTRKCILATNIAETSITIPGIKYVIDTGKHKEKRYITAQSGMKASSGFDTLLTKDITKSSAMQRTGRAGREGEGFCFRLFTEAAFNAMASSAEPEIHRVSLTSTILQLKCIGQDFEEIEFMDSPDYDSVCAAWMSLYLLGAIDGTDKKLTPIGRKMAAFPLEPSLARVVLASLENGCTHEILDIVSVLSASSKLFYDTPSDEREAAYEARRKYTHASGDHLTILNAVRSYRVIVKSERGKGERKEWCRKQHLNERALKEAGDIRTQLETTCERLKMDWKTATCRDDAEPVLKSLTQGLLLNAALLQPDGTYKQITGHSQVVKVHPSSSLVNKKVPAIIFDELIYTSQRYARGVSSISKSYIMGLGTLNVRAA